MKIKLNPFKQARLWLIAGAVTLLLAICGCSEANSQENITYVVVTGDAPAVGQPVGDSQTPLPQQPTPIPPSPTPDIPPDVALQIANRDMLNGFYEQAVALYDGILNREGADPEIRAAAALGMTQAALREGLFAQAVDASTILITNFPNDFRAHQAFFLRGDAYLGVSNWEAAIADFNQYLTLRPGYIDSYVYERMGDAYLALGQTQVAFDNYLNATSAGRSTVPQAQLLERLAQRFLAAGQVDQAVAQYDAILQFAQNIPYRASIAFAAAQAQYDSGNIESGLARMEAVVNEYSGQEQAYQALVILEENGRTVDGYTRGLIYYIAGFYDIAIDAFNTYTTQVALDQIPAQTYLLLGRAYRQVGNWEAALVAFQTVIQQYPNDALFGEALLESGRNAFLQGNIDEAITRYTAVADTYDYLAGTAAEALWRVGYLHSVNERPIEARQIFERLANQYPASEWAHDGLNIAALDALAAGDTFTAATLYNQLASITSGTDRSEALLQVAKLAIERGDQDAGVTALNDILATTSEGYLAARARDLLRGRSPFTSPPALQFTFDDVAEVTEAENWLRTTFGSPGEGPLWPLTPELQNDSRMLRGQELWTMGDHDSAETEFFELVNDNASNGIALYRLAIYLRSIGCYEPSIVATRYLLNAGGVDTFSAPSYLARMSYPAYYRDLVLEEAEERGIDPLLLFSLIMHESRFDTYATAAAGEKGLTQVIPSTGDYIADQLSWPNYQHADLFRPYAGIAFGAYYLDEQLERFDGYTYAALSGYNAGPGRAITWLEAAGTDPDLFMATIDISTVQLYIQRVYGYYDAYRQLYGTG